MHVGDSDSALAAIAPEVVYQFPEARWVLIERDVGEAVDSYQDYFGKDRYPDTPGLSMVQLEQLFSWCKDRCDEVKRSVPADRLLVIRFENLSRVDVGEAIWRWCIPTIRFSPERYRMLDSLRINVIAKKVQVMDGLISAWSKTQMDPHRSLPL